jgi:hypothetical protein
VSRRHRPGIWIFAQRLECAAPRRFGGQRGLEHVENHGTHGKQAVFLRVFLLRLFAREGVKLFPPHRVYTAGRPENQAGPKAKAGLGAGTERRIMPVIAKFCGIVIRIMWLRSLGTRLHAFHGDSEMVVELATLRIVDENVTEPVKKMVMEWARAHQRELLAGWWRPVGRQSSCAVGMG